MSTKRKLPAELKKWVPPEADAVELQLEKDLKRSLTGAEREAIRAESRREVWLGKYISFGGNIAAACAFTGISRSCFNHWMALFPEFSAAVSEVTESKLDLAELQLMKNIEEGKEASLFFYLCNKGKHRGWQHINKIQNQTLNKINVTVKYAQPNGTAGPADVRGKSDGEPEKLELLTTFEEEK